MKPSQLSVVIPAYNEEKVIAESLARVATYLEATNDPELIVVDDGSQDRTRRLIEQIASRYPFIRLIANEKNRGKGHAIRQGILASRGNWVLYTDSDLVYPIEEAEAFIKALEEGGDVAIGSRSHPATLFALHPRHFSYIYQRYLVGRTYIKVVNWLLRLQVTDTQCGFKVFRGEAARRIFARTRLFDFAFDVEAIFIARQLGYRLIELPGLLPLSWRAIQRAACKGFAPDVARPLANPKLGPTGRVLDQSARPHSSDKTDLSRTSYSPTPVRVDSVSLSVRNSWYPPRIEGGIQ